MIRTINNSIRSLLFQAKLHSSFWVEALQASVHVLNLLPSTSIANQIHISKLFKKPVSYSHLRVFGSLCCPNQNNSNASKLSLCSSRCMFLGYPQFHRGYRCFDLTTKKIIISRNVIFDETSFPYNDPNSPSDSSYKFLEEETEPSAYLKFVLINPTATPLPTMAAIAPSPSPVSTRAASAASEAPRHSMATRSKSGIHKPKHVLSLLTQNQSPLLKSYKDALSDPNWNPSMNCEFDAIIKSRTFDLVPRAKNTNIVRCMWLHKHKYDAQWNFKSHKSRLVANGKSQQEGIDFSETFSPVVKPATIQSVLHVALANDWSVHQLDVQNAFLHGTLDETVYMFQPPGFVDSTKPNHVCKLNRSIYGLKQSPRAWNARFVRFITSQGFKQSRSDASLFMYKRGNDIICLLLYVDDIIVTSSSSLLTSKIITAMKQEFPMTDGGLINSFLGIAAVHNNKGMFLHQSRYAEEILLRAGMQDCKPVATPVDLKSKLAEDLGKLLDNPTEYRSLAGALQYLTFTRPNIAYSVQQICLFMHDPRDIHMQALRRILRYLQRTKDRGLQLLKHQKISLTAYSDADWVGFPSTRRSTSGFCVCFRRQPPVLVCKTTGYSVTIKCRSRV